jgi:hypothetical protein
MELKGEYLIERLQGLQKKHKILTEVAEEYHTT